MGKHCFCSLFKSLTATPSVGGITWTIKELSSWHGEETLGVVLLMEAAENGYTQGKDSI